MKKKKFEDFVEALEKEVADLSLDSNFLASVITSYLDTQDIDENMDVKERHMLLALRDMALTLHRLALIAQGKEIPKISETKGERE